MKKSRLKNQNAHNSTEKNAQTTSWTFTVSSCRVGRVRRSVLFLKHWCFSLSKIVLTPAVKWECSNFDRSSTKRLATHKKQRITLVWTTDTEPEEPGPWIDQGQTQPGPGCVPSLFVLLNAPPFSYFWMHWKLCSQRNRSAPGKTSFTSQKTTRPAIYLT